ncbi:uncharacterized protein [Montipora foliosa]
MIKSQKLTLSISFGALLLLLLLLRHYTKLPNGYPTWASTDQLQASSNQPSGYPTLASTDQLQASSNQPSESKNTSFKGKTVFLWIRIRICCTQRKFAKQGASCAVVDSNFGQPKTARLHLIVPFNVMNSSGTPMSSTMVARQNEYIYCLQRNLLNPHVEAIHILFESLEEPAFIKALRLRMDWKLVFHFLGRRMRYKDSFGYASHFLIRKNTMLMNGDNYIDTGFEHLDETILGNKTMYALTRHETAENVKRCGVTDFCGPTANYIGSHDAFLFRLISPLSREFLDKVDYFNNMGGIEQVLMFNLRKYERFTIKNPCRILRIVHHHCSGYRNDHGTTIQGVRVDHYLKISTNNLAPFSGL